MIVSRPTFLSRPFWSARRLTVNTLSPAPIATRAAGIARRVDDRGDRRLADAPLTTTDDVGAAAGSCPATSHANIAGGVLHVDDGQHIMS